MPDPPRPALDPFQAVTIAHLPPGGGVGDRERSFQAVPLTISWEDLGDDTGQWVLDCWDIERDAPDCIPLKEIAGHVLTVEQARRLVVRFEWRPEGE